MLSIIIVLSLLVSPSEQFKLNCGGNSLPGGISSDNLLYTLPTQGYVRYYTSPIAPPNIYSSFAWAENGRPLIYAIPVAETELYKVTLSFAELDESNTRDGARVFDVNLNGRPVWRGADIWKLSGRKLDAHFDMIFQDVEAMGDMIFVMLSPILGNAFISGIEIYPGSSPTATPSVMKQGFITAPFPPSPSPRTVKVRTTPEKSSESTSQQFIDGDGSCGLGAQPPSIYFTVVNTLGFPVSAPKAQGALLGSGISERQLIVLGGGQPAVFSRGFGVDSISKWTRLANDPSGKLRRAAQAAIGDTLYVAGGELTGRMAARFDRATGWQALPDLPMERIGGSLLVVHSRPGKRTLLHVGGRGRPPCDSWQLGDDGIWHRAGPSIEDLDGAGTVETCGRHFVIGGKVNGKTTAKVYEWIPKAGNWSKKAPSSMPEAKDELISSVVAYKCGMIVIGGGSSNSVIYWDSSTNIWHTIGKWPGAKTKVCGIDDDTIICASNGETAAENTIYIGKLL